MAPGITAGEPEGSRMEPLAMQGMRPEALPHPSHTRDDQFTAEMCDPGRRTSTGVTDPILE
ncbi:MAG: hypothetical protein O3C10_04815 [Chloroflexi bacterium]|nr:hypothetical protein [Chloroflexota bacterium]